MEGLINTAQAVLTGVDVAFQRSVRSEERAWRQEDLVHRQLERELLLAEGDYMQQERAFLAAQVQQAHVDNARALWQRFVNRNRTEVQEKTEQLKALSSLSALLAGFALVSFLEFQFPAAVNSDQGGYHHVLLPLFALSTCITVGVEMAAVVLCSLMLANILRTAKTYVSEQEEAEFMHRCRLFVSEYCPGDRPPAPPRTFAAHWSRRCEAEWRTAFRLFSTGVPTFFINLALAGWIKFLGAARPTSAALVTVAMGLALCYNLWTHRKWGEYLLQAEGGAGEDDAVAHTAQPAVGLPFDWHLPPLPTAGLGLGLATPSQHPPQMQPQLHPWQTHRSLPSHSRHSTAPAPPQQQQHCAPPHPHLLGGWPNGSFAQAPHAEQQPSQQQLQHVQGPLPPEPDPGPVAWPTWHGAGAQDSTAGGGGTAGAYALQRDPQYGQALQQQRASRNCSGSTGVAEAAAEEQENERRRQSAGSSSTGRRAGRTPSAAAAAAAPATAASEDGAAGEEEAPGGEGVARGAQYPPPVAPASAHGGGMPHLGEAPTGEASALPEPPLSPVPPEPPPPLLPPQAAPLLQRVDAGTAASAALPTVTLRFSAGTSSKSAGEGARRRGRS